MRAVIFDLWDTLVEWPVDDAEVLRERIAALVGLDDDEFGRRWSDSYRPSQTGPLADAYRALGVPDEHVEAEVGARHAFGRLALRPRPGATAALAALREHDVRLAVLSVCSEEVPAAWPESELAGLFDVETFSSECGLMKPEPEIYLQTAAALGVEPAECLFVGDGANDELAGAARVGMTPVHFLPAGTEPLWSHVRDWDGLSVSALEDVLALV
ncbi:MAG TPA: HAD-IA family hydrolase [Gaiellaceae bacterium]|jgi:putative hydrolase of the HAD superfamily